MVRDLGFAVRQLWRRPGFTLVVILTLALGIGANAAIFSVVDTVLLRPLPYADAGRLVRLWSAYPERGLARGTTSPQDLTDWAGQSKTVESMGAWAAFQIGGLVLMRDGVPTELRTDYVTPGFFSTLAMPAQYGRTLIAADHQDGANDVVVLSHGAWQRLFGADRGVVGRPVTLSGQPFTVIGVMPQGFDYPSADTEAWVPLSLIPESGIPRRRDVRFLSVLGRLAPHVDLDSARREMGLIAGRLSRAYPRANEGLTAVTVKPLRDVLVGPVRPAMLAIFGAVALVLLIGCVNVASLLLVRAESRSSELALRTALGASRGALVHQLLTESVLLALIGGALGLWVGVWGTRSLVALAPANIPRLAEVGLSIRMLLFTTLVSVATALAVGLLPALRASRPDLRNAIDGSAAIGFDGRGSGRLRATLVVTQVALVAVLAVGAGLLVRSYASVRSVDTGFDSDGLLTVSVSASGDDFQQYLAEALQRIRRVPGVHSAAMVRPLPLGPGTFAGERYEFQISGEANSDSERQPRADIRFVSPGFFQTMGIPLLAGRDFSDHDDADAPRVVVLSQSTAKRFWPQTSPVGAHIRFGDASAEVIGVVADIKQTSLEETTEPAAYAAFAQFGRRGMSFVIRTQAPVAVLKRVEKAIWALRPEQPIQNVASMDQLVGDAVAGRRFSMSLLTAFALLALFLAALGIYGLVAYAVGRRVREIGIRVALGAQPMSVLRLVIRRAITLVAFGVVVGLTLAAASTRVIQRLLFGVGRFDPWVFVGSAVILLLVATFACLLPAHRAARVDPMEVLRHE